MRHQPVFSSSAAREQKASALSLRCAPRYISLISFGVFLTICRTPGGEEDYGEEEGAEEEQPEEESKEPAQEETDQQRQMRMIAEQKKAQEEALRKAKEKAAEEALEETKEEGVTDATKITVADEFDIDDI